MGRIVVAIHQPDFMPWLGFFLKAWRADIFVVLEHVKNNPKDGSWFRRVKLIANGKPTWISLPIKKSSSSPFIELRQMVILYNNTTSRIFEKYKKTVFLNYKDCPFFEQYYPLFTEYFDSSERFLVKKNMNFILKVFEMLDISPQIYYSSKLNCQYSKTALLVEIVKKVGGNVYLAGDGAKGYQDDSLFEKEGIEVVYNNFVPRPYPQCNTKEFIPGLSILDAFMNIGADGVKKMLEEYRKI